MSQKLLNRLTIGSALRSGLTDFWKLVGQFTSALSLIVLAKDWFSFSLSGVVASLAENYARLVRDPILQAFNNLGLIIDPWVADASVLYLALGAICARSIGAIFDFKYGTPAKGVWGWVVRNPLTKPVNFEKPVGRVVFYVLATIFWPLLATEYFLRNRFVFVRHMDDSGQPSLGAIVGVFTGTKRRMYDSIPGRWARYNPDFDHEIESDMWFRYAGDLRAILYANAVALALVLGLFFALNVVPFDLVFGWG